MRCAEMPQVVVLNGAEWLRFVVPPLEVPVVPVVAQGGR